jgi:hypothetical protein
MVIVWSVIPTVHADLRFTVFHPHPYARTVRRYFIERADKYMTNPNFTNIIYKGSDMVQPEDMEFEGAAYDDLAVKQAEWTAEQDAINGRARRQTTPYVASKNTCGVALIVDKRLMDAKFSPGGRSHSLSFFPPSLLSFSPWIVSRE